MKILANNTILAHANHIVIITDYTRDKVIICTADLKIAKSMGQDFRSQSGKHHIHTRVSKESKHNSEPIVEDYTYLSTGD